MRARIENPFAGGIATQVERRDRIMKSNKWRLEGKRTEVHIEDERYPEGLKTVFEPPEILYVIGKVEVLETNGLAVIGARKATPYGLSCTRRFAGIAAAKGITIVSGGARGCDSAAHTAALDAKGVTVAVFGCGCDYLYPPENCELFQRIIDNGGAVISEHPWETEPMPYMFRARNRLIAGLSEAVFIVEAGLPSGTFSTADEALNSGKEVLVVPGAITSSSSHGSNRLLYQGAIPVIDDATFEDALFATLGFLRQPDASDNVHEVEDPVIAAVLASPMDMESLFQLADTHYEGNVREKLTEALSDAEAANLIARQMDGRWGPVSQV